MGPKCKGVGLLYKVDTGLNLPTQINQYDRIGRGNPPSADEATDPPKPDCLKLRPAHLTKANSKTHLVTTEDTCFGFLISCLPV